MANDVTIIAVMTTVVIVAITATLSLPPLLLPPLPPPPLLPAITTTTATATITATATATTATTSGVDWYGVVVSGCGNETVSVWRYLLSYYHIANIDHYMTFKRSVFTSHLSCARSPSWWSDRCLLFPRTCSIPVPWRSPRSCRGWWPRSTLSCSPGK